MPSIHLRAMGCLFSSNKNAHIGHTHCSAHIVSFFTGYTTYGRFYKTIKYWLLMGLLLVVALNAISSLKKNLFHVVESILTCTDRLSTPRTLGDLKSIGKGWKIDSEYWDRYVGS